MARQLDRSQKHYVVWGWGKTGRATAHFLASVGARVTVVDQADATRHQESLAQLPDDLRQKMTFYWGGTQPDASALEDVEVVLLSPGVPYDHPALIALREHQLDTIASLHFAATEVEAAGVPIVAITGTAGKSTTVSLLGEMLKASGLRTFVGGNLGTPLISILHTLDQYDCVVIECSSFQLEACPAFRPLVAGVTNLSANHLDRHKTMEAYAAAKAMMFHNQRDNAWAIFPAGDTWCEQMVDKSAAQKLTFSTDETEQGAQITASGILIRLPGAEPIVFDLSRFGLLGAHNRENAALAALAAHLAGATTAAIQQALDTFRSLPHRLEPIAEVAGVRYVNDSKSTTPESTSQAIKAFAQEQPTIHLLLGGRDKGTGFAALTEPLKQDNIALYLFGEAADVIAPFLPSTQKATTHPLMEDALAHAARRAQPGEVVLLSPACASFDQFRNFEERGEVFAKWVRGYNPQQTPGETNERTG